MDTHIKKNIIESYQVDAGFIVHDAAMLSTIYKALGIDPKSSLDPRIYELEGITHFFQRGVEGLFKRMGITKEDYVLSFGEGAGGPSRLLTKITGAHVLGVDVNPNQIAKARELAVLHGLREKLAYHEHNVEDFSFDKKDFTKAYVNETCGHWQEKAKAFARIFDHCVPGATLGFNAWIRGDKGDLNDAYDPIPDFRDLYKRWIWFQDDLPTYKQLLTDAGFTVLEMFDCTDRVDIRMRARLKADRQWQIYEEALGRSAKESGIAYYTGMLKTHFDYLRYGVIIARKNS
ncbi:MAG: class I SAM-dependent methyltransferase [Candidatus Omnitrophota bacterium]|nr:class I SAM-dependent methyltransferase [Candidatus Omnitrophota bacterium]